MQLDFGKAIKNSYRISTDITYNLGTTTADGLSPEDIERTLEKLSRKTRFKPCDMADVDRLKK